jgi:hypothetical protein
LAIYQELTIPIGYDAAFDLVIKAASSIGNVSDANKMMGIVSFKQGMSLLKMRNPVKYSVNVVRQDDKSTLIRVICNSNDGTIGLNSSARSYQDFFKALSDASKEM